MPALSHRTLELAVGQMDKFRLILLFLFTGYSASSILVTEGDDKEQTGGKIGSLMIIFNTWNAMIGCGTVTVPWAFQ